MAGTGCLTVTTAPTGGLRDGAAMQATQQAMVFSMRSGDGA